MKFIKYPKIHRLGAEENEGILDGICVIQEKVDGANTSIWFEDGFIRCGSRSRHITEGFNGFIDYVMTNDAIKRVLEEHPDWRLFGEWLVRHTLQYNETSYKKFYLFDIMLEDGTFAVPAFVKTVAETYGIHTPQTFAIVEKPDVKYIESFVGKTNLGTDGEGVVIRNMDFRNKFGDLEYAKIVTQKFKEDNGLVFGGNNKHSDTYEEMYLVNKYCTLERVQKIMHKIQPQIDKKLDLEHIPRVANTVYHDLITEEAWEIAGRGRKIDFKEFKRLATKKIVQIYKDIIMDTISVADRQN